MAGGAKAADVFEPISHLVETPEWNHVADFEITFDDIRPQSLREDHDHIARKVAGGGSPKTSFPIFIHYS